MLQPWLFLLISNQVVRVDKYLQTEIQLCIWLNQGKSLEGYQ